MKNFSKKSLLIIIGVIILLIAFAIIFLGGNKEKSKEEEQNEQKEKVYNFDFFDGTVPGYTFRGKINLSTGEVDFIIISGCSLPDPEDCPGDTRVQGKLNKEQLELVNKTYERINPKDNEFFLNGVSYLLNGSRICDDETNQTCEAVGKEILNSLD